MVFIVSVIKKTEKDAFSIFAQSELSRIDARYKMDINFISFLWQTELWRNKWEKILYCLSIFTPREKCFFNNKR